MEFEFVKEEYNKRSNKDRRVKCDWYLISYKIGGQEYRKSFEFNVGKPFDKVQKYISDYMSFTKET